MLGWTFWFLSVSMNTLFNTNSLNTTELLYLLQTGKDQEEENITLSYVLTLKKEQTQQIDRMVEGLELQDI